MQLPDATARRGSRTIGRAATRRALAGTALLAMCELACSSTDSTKAKTETPDASSPAPRVRPAGPAADMSQELTGGNGVFIGAANGLTVPDGYVEHEYVAAGTATAYEATGSLTDDGHWTFEPSTTAAYRTRVLVERPANAADASGTVVVEWLNVSGGVDANPEYASLSEEITRQGHIWVGVSAQIIGVEGGAVLVSVPVPGGDNFVGKGLKAIDPVRYGSLAHPGDGYSFDIFTQVTRALLAGGTVLGGVKPRLVVAAGESQSAFALTTYYDGVQPLTLAFDGFFVHSRGATALPLVGPGASADLATSITSPSHPIFRDDLDAPVIDVQAESDVTGILDSVVVRQPDSDRFRLWETAGTSHADLHLLGSAASSIDCGVPINDGPLHLIAKAAFRGLETWLRTGAVPPIAPRLSVNVTDAGAATVLRDGDGIALGGVRTPPVDVPVEVLSGAPGPNSSLICLLLGSTTPLPTARLTALYPTRAAYQQQYEADAEEVINAGFVLEPDHAALTAFSQPALITP